MKGRTRFRWTQFSIKGILLATLLVATFYAGRLSHQLEVDRSNEKPAVGPPIVTVQSGNVRYINLGDITSLPRGRVISLFDVEMPSPRHIEITDVPITSNDAPEPEIPNSIEQGMKATELEMQQRFGDFR